MMEHTTRLLALAIVSALLFAPAVLSEERPAITERSPDVALFEGEAKIDSAGCEACRTLVEQFYKGWEKTISNLAADGTFESRPGQAPKIVYNQQIEDYLQGFCASEYMKGYAGYVNDGCEKIMKKFKRGIVGKFLHGEERYGTEGVKSLRPERINDVCTTLAKACPALPPPAAAVVSIADKCGACKGVVTDALFIMRRDRLIHDNKPETLRKRKLEVFELLEPMCMDAFHRHTDFPAVYNSVCLEMWEEDEEGLIGALVLSGGGGWKTGDAHRAVCADAFSYCTAADFVKPGEL
ncbi:hypothetical protein T484DRAFT_1947349 [Baffinella frigidus]|nr:hypothetical protein T484DRAFT_1947349 [Cryptophyta sp. CCMP2293]|mmetsp:Transcript_43343/g.101995  ORF Transcript_43343/g.101995 Transcript_43343/m.101995 type:complete len:295 (+) Transcript_43343:40-924(+)